jgi:hypothetical protein
MKGIKSSWNTGGHMASWMVREIFEPILVDFEVDFIRIHIVSNIFP